jgi:tetratricopeptide (TPR) repeat protein
MSSPRHDTSSELLGRWQTLQLLSPVFELVERAAPRADFDHHGYDLAQLALRLIDYVVLHQASLEGSVSPAAATDHLSQIARRMHPTDPARPWAKVAKLVFNTVLNDGRLHEATWVEPDTGAGAQSQPFRFRLLRLVDSDVGAAVTATDQAIVLYLQALNTDLADRALALKLMVQIQMQAGEFDKALDSARQATRTARGLSASLREKLADTRRDVTAVDWHTEMPAWLTSILDQIAQQLERDRQLLDLAAQASADPDAGAACTDISTEVQTGADVWIKLERYLQQAIPVFLEAQKAQRFRPRGIAAAIDLCRDVLEPAITAPDERFAAAGQRLIEGIAPPTVPVCWGLGELCDVLLRAPVSYERRDPDIDDPGDLGQPVGDSIPDDVAARVADILALAQHKPARLSELISLARADTGDAGDTLRLLDVLWGAALWVYVAGGDNPADERPRRADLAAAVGALTAIQSGDALGDQRYAGPDLVLATPIALDEIDLNSSGAA